MQLPVSDTSDILPNVWEQDYVSYKKHLVPNYYYGANIYHLCYSNIIDVWIMRTYISNCLCPGLF